MKGKQSVAQFNGKNDILRKMIIGNLEGPGRENNFFPVVTIFSNVHEGFLGYSGEK